MNESSGKSPKLVKGKVSACCEAAIEKHDEQGKGIDYRYTRVCSACSQPCNVSDR